MIHEGLDIKFSPSGDILAALCYDSNITLFDSKISSEIGTIDGKLDLDPGRQSTEIIKKKTSEKSKYENLYLLNEFMQIWVLLEEFY